MTKRTGVRTQHPDYVKMLPVWNKCNDAAEGEDAVHARGVTYLPKLIGEKDDAYKARKERTPFFNATWRTISGLKGMMFRKDPVAELPEAIKEYTKDINMAGTPLDMFAQELSEEVLKPGRAGVLVDYPMVETEGMTVAQAAAAGVRPMMQLYKATDIINWKVQRVAGVMRLTLLVLRESADVAGKDEFDNETEERYRVLDLMNGLYRQRVFKIGDKNDEQVGADIFPQMNSKAMTFIPFIMFGADSLNPGVVTPPLIDLINMNFHHYTVSADYEHGCHYSGLPTLFIFGQAPDDDNPIYLGGPAANCIPDPQGKAEYAHVDSGFEALQNNLESKEKQMAVLGARMLEQQKTAVESSETQQQRVNGEGSQLASMANVISMGLEKALKIFSEWAGAAGEIKYQINTDYLPVGMSAQELTALVSAWQSNAISGETLHMNLQKGEIIDAETTYEEEQERINSNPAGMKPLEAVA